MPPQMAARTCNAFLPSPPRIAAICTPRRGIDNMLGTLGLCPCLRAALTKQPENKNERKAEMQTWIYFFVTTARGNV